MEENGSIKEEEGWKCQKSGLRMKVIPVNVVKVDTLMSLCR